MRKQISFEQKEYLWDRLREFEDTVPMTRPERDALHRWVRGGHDINSNPWGYDYGDGWEMNYLEAMRMEVFEYERMKELAEENQPYTLVFSATIKHRETAPYPSIQGWLLL